VNTSQMVNKPKSLRRGAQLVVRWVPDWHLYVLLVGVLAWTAVSAPGLFWSLSNLSSIGFQMPELGLLTLAVALTLISGGINLATVATANFAGFLMAFLLKAGFVRDFGDVTACAYYLLVLFCGMGTGALVGLLNGVIIAFLGVSPILATLGTMTLLTGIGLLYARGVAVSGLPSGLVEAITGSILWVPVPLILFLATALVIGFVLTRTRLGLTLYMLGSNQRATSYSGIDTKRVLIIVYVISGALSGLAGFVMMCRFNSVNSNYGSSYLLVSVLAAVLGGVDPFGGRGRVTSICVALILLQCISSLMNLMSWSSHLTLATWGILLLIGLRFARR
jgi:simple sugar transport system permease protein